MLKTYVRPSRELRNNYAELAGIVKDHDHIIITNNGKGESVLIGIEDYAKYEEFLHQRYIEEALAQAEKQAADTNSKWLSHEDVFKTIRAKYEI